MQRHVVDTCSNVLLIQGLHKLVPRYPQPANIQKQRIEVPRVLGIFLGICNESTW